MIESAEEYILRRKLMNETAASRKAQANFGELMQDIGDAVNGYFANNRRLKGSALKGLFEAIDATVRGRMTVARSRFDERPPTKARPKSEAYEAMYVIVSNQEADSESREMIFRLHSLRFFGTRKLAEVQVSSLPVAFRKHAASRRYERDGSADHAVQEIGESLAEWLPLILAAEDAVTGAGSNCFAAPAGDGMLLGHYDGSAAVPCGLRYRFDDVGVLREEIPASPLAPSLYSANTFIGAFEMQENQEELAACFATWRSACGDGYLAAVEDVLWPDRAISPPAGPGLPDNVMEALGLLVSDGRALRAMGFKERSRRPALAETDLPEPEEPGTEESQHDGDPSLPMNP